MRTTLFCIIWVTLTVSISPLTIEQSLEKAGTLYFIDFDAKKDTTAFEESIKILETLHEHYPQNGVVKVLLGRLYIRKGKDQFWFWNKNKWAEKGLALMDEAVSENPTHVIIRYERALYTCQMPSFFKRWKSAENDLDTIMLLFQNSDTDTILKDWQSWQAFNSVFLKNITTDDVKLVCLKQRVYYYAGILHYKLRNYAISKDMMKRVISFDPNSSYGLYAFLWLNTTVFK